MEFEALIKQKISGISEKQVQMFKRYFEMLVDWNTRVNLTAITDCEAVIEKHFLDSLLPLELIGEGSKCIDIGTGAGFPGIPIAIMREDTHMVLLDSLNKRVNFLNAVKEELGLENIVCIHARGEEAAHDIKYREKFDITLSRAVAGVNSLVEVSVPFLKVGGKSIMLKGPKAKEELLEAQNALKALSASADIVEFPSSWGERCALIVTKNEKTQKQYPRKGMFKKPL